MKLVIQFQIFLTALIIWRLAKAQMEDWTCEENFVSIGSSCYYFHGVDTLLNYTAAMNFCQKMDAGLADYTRNDTVNYLDLLLKSGLSQTPLTPIWVQSTDKFDCKAINFPTDISRAFNIPCNKEAAIVCRKAACEAGTLPRGPVCYWMHSERVTYAEAEKSCRTEKQSPGRLAMVHNAEILEILSRVVRAYQVSGSTWLGMNDREIEGVWRYSDGTLVRAQDVEKLWLKGEPNGDRTENCGAIFGKRWKFLLGDEGCNLTYPALCEVDATALSVDFGPFVLLCQKGFRYFDGHCYRLINDRESNYVEAFDHCTSLGSSLSLARSEQTLKFMRALADEVKTGNATYPNGTLVPPLRSWIGMMRDPSSYLNRGNLKTWLWSDGIYQAPDVLAAPNVMVKECPPNLVEWPSAFTGPPTENSRKTCVNFVAADNFYCKLRSESCSSKMGYFCQHKACNNGWYPFSINTCLILITSPRSYVNATKYCEALKSQIVFVTSNRDLQVLRQLYSKLIRGGKAANKKPSSVWIQLVMDDYLSATKRCYVAKTDSVNVTIGDCEEERAFFCQEPGLTQPRGKAQQLFESQMLSDGSYLPKDDDDDESTTIRGVTPLLRPTLPTYNITRKDRPDSNGDTKTDSPLSVTTEDYEYPDTGDDNGVNRGDGRTTKAGRVKPTRKPNTNDSGNSAGRPDKSGNSKGDTSSGGSSTNKGDTSSGGTSTNKGDSSSGGSSTNKGDSSSGGSSTNKGDTSSGGSSANKGDSSSGGSSANKGDSSSGGSSANKGDSSSGGSSANKGDSSSGGSSAKKGDTSQGGKPNNSGGERNSSSTGKPDSSGGSSSGDKGQSSSNTGSKGDSSSRPDNSGGSAAGSKGDSSFTPDNSGGSAAGSKGDSSSTDNSGGNSAGEKGDRGNERPGDNSSPETDYADGSTTELSPSWSRTTSNPPKTNTDASNAYKIRVPKTTNVNENGHEAILKIEKRQKVLANTY